MGAVWVLLSVVAVWSSQYQSAWLRRLVLWWSTPSGTVSIGFFQVGPGSSLVPDDERMRNLAWRDTIGGVPVGYMSTVVRVHTIISIHTWNGGDLNVRGSRKSDKR